ncbi:hypothetical protein EJ082_15140 [Brevundimonas diminuta]|uniref:Uncharacterized protein n=1 Tax=Brevundimonas diminuta TaxID=293 RepID=A0A410P059_BREDI|nr:hypothetical protein [Brevundimonas diminuta]MBD3574301.1 hypothetical protein [Brevundimonas diminuta]QAT15542.1 hypothetical protein EQG53_14995 [Brevundimonas diminuta]QQB90241.1 hypothetical protein I6H83_07455 [Brevundimonas diminuta]GEC02238.1 hypothetical protein BDI01nite_33020 [Brevundimonas diminuta]
MGEINLPREQQDALAAIDDNDMNRLIDRAVEEQRSSELRQALLHCGPAIGTQLHYFEKALDRHRTAKAARKRAETAGDLRRAGYDLLHTIQNLKKRVELERKDAELFFVEDGILHPRSLTRDLSVRVSYRWRQTIDDAWQFGTITFLHTFDPKLDHLVLQPARKLCKTRQDRELQDRLYETWVDLMRHGLYSVRDYFRAGGDGAAIPDSFQAKPDSYSRGLNNFSAKFW